MDNGVDREEELQFRQDGQLYPVGRSLRSTFPAPDGEELQPRITSLMVELAHQPYETARPVSTAPVDRVSPPPAGGAPSILSHLKRLFRP
jgi:hypothetical protein